MASINVPSLAVMSLAVVRLDRAYESLKRRRRLAEALPGSIE